MDIQKAEIFGKKYILDEVFYSLKKEVKRRKEFSRLASYVCTSLQLIPQGKFLQKDVFSIFDEEKPVEDRSAEEIINDIFGKMGLERIKNVN